MEKSWRVMGKKWGNVGDKKFNGSKNVFLHGFTGSMLPIISWSLSKTKAYASYNILYLYLVNISYVQYCGIHASILFSCQRQGSWIQNIASECFSLPTAPPYCCTWTMHSHTWTINSQVFLAIEGLAAQEAVKLTYV